MGRAPVHEVGAPGDDAGLGSAEELVAREDGERGAGLEGLAHGGFVPQPLGRAAGEPRAGGVEEPGAQVDGDGRSEPGELGDARGLGEPGDRVVRLVHLEDEGDVGGRVLDRLT